MNNERRPAKGDLIGFYGTLMRGLGGLEALGVSAGLRFVGPCICIGTLHDLGAYPGLLRTLDRETDARVVGELFAIVDPRITEALDEFEGVVPGRPDESLYLREYVDLIEPRDSRAWLYVYNQPLPGPDAEASRIKGGDWRAHIAPLARK